VSVTASSPSAVCRAPGCQASVNFSGYRRSDSLYCSNACRQRAYRQRHALDPPELDVECVEHPGEACRWAPSCSREGCWRRECEQSGRPLFGIGPRTSA
jgi:hypothetical protein